MSIAQHRSPVFTVSCSNPACTGPDLNGPASDDDCRTRYFDSVQDARVWAETDGWALNPVLCPPCAAEAREKAEQAADIAAAFQDAISAGGEA